MCYLKKYVLIKNFSIYKLNVTFINNKMLGYNAEMSSKERLAHHKTLQGKFDKKLSTELNFAYNWVGNGIFLDVLSNKSPNQIHYCREAMENPPLKLLDHMAKTTDVPIITLKKKSFTAEVDQTPSCILCNRKLATSIVEIIDFALMKCNCGTKYVHVECADKLITSTSQCTVCKKYIMLNNIKHSSLQETLLRF